MTLNITYLKIFLLVVVIIINILILLNLIPQLPLVNYLTIGLLAVIIGLDTIHYTKGGGFIYNVREMQRKLNPLDFVDNYKSRQIDRATGLDRSQYTTSLSQSNKSSNQHDQVSQTPEERFDRVKSDFKKLGATDEQISKLSIEFLEDYMQIIQYYQLPLDENPLKYFDMPLNDKYAKYITIIDFSNIDEMRSKLRNLAEKAFYIYTHTSENILMEEIIDMHLDDIPAYAKEKIKIKQLSDLQSKGLFKTLTQDQFNSIDADVYNTINSIPISLIKDLGITNDLNNLDRLKDFTLVHKLIKSYYGSDYKDYNAYMELYKMSFDGLKSHLIRRLQELCPLIPNDIDIVSFGYYYDKFAHEYANSVENDKKTGFFKKMFIKSYSLSKQVEINASILSDGNFIKNMIIKLDEFRKNYKGADPDYGRYFKYEYFESPQEAKIRNYDDE
jgi:hypothetical protein